MVNLNVYVALLLGLIFVILYAIVCTLFYNLNYRRMNNKENMNRKQITINLVGHGIIAIFLVGLAIYLSYFK
ncbi:hypothetical protein [Staphylococcus devriesei]|uniref:hypothetical protein n=1 Tax=Staphylococcus devriesei TaxID=586733 RepID=UPI000E06FFDB|nr:hypothetical protein [Staphylococcus devriesei]SUM04458.1 membrane protein [Staphylococcus devriesei]